MMEYFEGWHYEDEPAIFRRGRRLKHGSYVILEAKLCDDKRRVECDARQSCISVFNEWAGRIGAEPVAERAYSRCTKKKFGPGADPLLLTGDELLRKRVTRKIT